MELLCTSRYAGSPARIFPDLGPCERRSFMSKKKYLPIISRKESCKLAVSDICYVYRTNRKMQFETDLGVKTTYKKIADIEKNLGPEFYKCTSGCIVNLTRIVDMRDGIVYFDDGKTIKLGKESFLRLKQKFNAYILGLISSDDENEESEDNEEND